MKLLWRETLPSYWQAFGPDGTAIGAVDFRPKKSHTRFAYMAGFFKVAQFRQHFRTVLAAKLWVEGNWRSFVGA